MDVSQISSPTMSPISNTIKLTNLYPKSLQQQSYEFGSFSSKSIRDDAPGHLADRVLDRGIEVEEHFTGDESADIFIIQAPPPKGEELHPWKILRLDGSEFCLNK